MRYAAEADTPLLRDWFAAFVAETGVRDDPATLERSIRSRLASQPPAMCLWEVDGESVSMAGNGGRESEAARIGPVYTPPEHRGHGYATSLVAELSRRLLHGGHPGCLLYTDLANPTSNAIYRRIGYLPVCDSAEYEFQPLS
jgi:predicted GNAT family acetyltransferase